MLTPRKRRAQNQLKPWRMQTCKLEQVENDSRTASSKGAVQNLKETEDQKNVESDLNGDFIHTYFSTDNNSLIKSSLLYEAYIVGSIHTHLENCCNSTTFVQLCIHQLISAHLYFHIQLLDSASTICKCNFHFQVCCCW